MPEMQPQQTKLEELESRIRVLEYGAKGVHVSGVTWGQGGAKFLPFAQAVHMILQHLGVSFEHIPGTPEHFVIKKRVPMKKPAKT